MRAIVNEKLQGKEKSTIHRFEVAGLGIAPFRFTGTVTEKVFCSPGSPPKAGSSCDYCGTGIRYEFWVTSASNMTFKVGCDCIHKTEDRGLIQQISAAERKLRDAKNIAAKQRKADKLAARVELAKAKLPSVRGLLSEQKHPNQYMSEKGLTLLDYINWCFENRAADKACYLIENTK